MAAINAYYETQLVIAQSSAVYYEDELRHTRNKLVEAKSSIDHLLSEISDYEHRARQLAEENKRLRDIIVTHIDSAYGS